jgi:hypothetical protein
MGQNRSSFQERAEVKAALSRVNFFGAVWIVTIVGLASWLAWMILDNQLPAEYLDQDAVIIPDPAEQGGRVTAKIKVKRNRVCPGTVSRLLRDDTTGQVVAIYDPVPAAFGRIGGSGLTSKTFELPEGLPPVVRYQAEVCFQCNALQILRPLCTRVPDIVFRVKRPANVPN